MNEKTMEIMASVVTERIANVCEPGPSVLSEINSYAHFLPLLDH